MRILHTNMLRGWGGQSNRILEDMEAARRAGHEVALAAPHGSVLRQRCLERGIPAWPRYRFRPPWQVWNALPDIVRLVRDARGWRPDLIHVHGSQDTWLVVIARRWFARWLPPVVRTKHNVFPWRTSAGNRWLYPKIDGFVSISTAIDEQIAAFPGLGGKPRQLVYSIPDVEHLEASGPPADFPRLAPGTFVWGSTGRARPEKGHDILLRAFARLRAERPETFLVIAGGGNGLGMLRELAETLGLGPDAVWLPGHREDVPALLHRCDAYALASRSEGLGTAILEALSVGLPVVASKVGGIPDSVIDGETGLLVEAENPVALAEAMRRMMDDGGMRERLGAAGRARVREHFTREALAKGTLEFYGRMAKG